MKVNDYNENYGNGWIKLYRSIKDHWVFENEKYLKWWVIMLFEVNHSERKFTRNYEVYTIKQGQSVNSLRTWADLFKCTPKTVSKFFKLLESDAMISVKKIGKGKQALSLITIDNYGTYQGASKQTLPQEVNKEETKSKQTLPTNKNVKNYKNEKNSDKFDYKYLDAKFREFAKNKNLDSVKVLEQFDAAFDYYEDKNWVNSKGKPVKDPYMTIRNNWFKRLSEFAKPREHKEVKWEGWGED